MQEEFHPEDHQEGEQAQEQHIEQLGEAAQDQSAPEGTPGELYGGYMGNDASVNPVSGQSLSREEEPDTRITDEHKAQVMADQGDHDRSVAVMYRSDAEKLEDVPPEDHAKVYSDLEAAGVATTFDIPEESEDQDIVEYLERRSVFHDKMASSREDWAGILHDHPPSADYIELHQNRAVWFTPDGLRTTETMYKNSLKDIKAMKERMAEVERFEDFSLPLFLREALPFASVEPYYTLAVDQANRDEEEDAEANPIESYNLDDETIEQREKEVDALLKNPSTTLEQMYELTKKIISEDYETIVKSSHETNTVLDDIRSGRAAEYRHEQNQG